jgi:hypothetical protein
VRIIEAGNQVMISTTYRNIIENDLSFVGIIEIRDQSGITVYLGWQTGVIKPLGNKTFGVSWFAEAPNFYMARTFAFSDLETYKVLSAVEIREFEVK